MDEPVSDAVRGILDGHIVLTRKLAVKTHYPAVDVLQSISRLALTVTGNEVKQAAGYVKKMLAVYADAEDLINVGAYVKGSNAEIDEAIERVAEINGFLRQGIAEKSTLAETWEALGKIAGVPIPLPVEEKADETVPV